MSDAPMPPASEPPFPPPRQAWYAVGVMTVALKFNFLDRGVIEPIKRDMRLTDTQASIVVGFAFVAFPFWKGVKPYGEIIARG